MYFSTFTNNCVSRLLSKGSTSGRDCSRAAAVNEFGIPRKPLATLLQRFARPEPSETTPAAVESLLDGLTFKAGARVLVSSGATGAICKPLLARGALVDAVEVHTGRVAALHSMRHPALNVHRINFLKLPPAQIYDIVLIDRPLIERLWRDHVQHAIEFLAPTGELRAILPTAAKIGTTTGHENFRTWDQKYATHDLLHNLTTESVAYARTHINTVLLTIQGNRSQKFSLNSY